MWIGLWTHAAAAERKAGVASRLGVLNARGNELADPLAIRTKERKKVVLSKLMVGVVHFAEVVALKVERRRAAITPVRRDQPNEATRRDDGPEAWLRDETEAAHLVGLA